MTDTPWTPGPWRVNPRASTNVEAPNGRGIAATGGYRDNTSNGAYADENDANARLIAAAPDLAEALERLINRDPSAPDSNAKLWNAARAALARAKGATT